jgi:hypothetical protein
MTYSTSPTESSLTITSSKIRSQVPSAVHNRNRSCAVFHGPCRSGRSRRASWRTSRPVQVPPFVQISDLVTMYSSYDVEQWLRSRRIDPSEAA